MATLSLADVRRVASLARLAISDDELDTLRMELERVLDLADSLSVAQVADVPPTSHPHELVVRLRQDVVRPSLARDELLSQAPDARSGGFSVPDVMGRE